MDQAAPPDWRSEVGAMMLLTIDWLDGLVTFGFGCMAFCAFVLWRIGR